MITLLVYGSFYTLKSALWNRCCFISRRILRYLDFLRLARHRFHRYRLLLDHALWKFHSKIYLDRYLWYPGEISFLFMGWLQLIWVFLIHHLGIMKNIINWKKIFDLKCGRIFNSENKSQIIWVKCIFLSLILWK